MYKLEKSYGKTTFKKWKDDKPDDLRDTQTNADQANENPWEV